jgi:diguanylate cyclase (GGDEF)-like protein
MWRRSHKRLIVAVLAAVTVLIGGVLAGIQADAQRQLINRFDLRVSLGSQFVHSYVADILDRERESASATLSGASVSRAEFEAVVATFGFEAALLLDADGLVLHGVPHKPALQGVAISARYAHLAAAVEGTPTLSNVVPSAARSIPVVAFAAPFDTPWGRRVLSGAYDVSKTPLSAYLANSMPFRDGSVLLIDTTGSIVASNLASSRAMRSLSDDDAALGRAVETDSAGRYTDDGTERYFSVANVPSSPFRLVASVPVAQLFAGTSGWPLVLPWLILACLAVGALYTLRVMFELDRSRSALDDLARVDELTGLYNRRHMQAELTSLVERNRRAGEALTVLMVDIDHFKMVNDRYGHENGDVVLRATAGALRGCLRAGDVIGRWGGEEFLVLLPATSLRAGQVVAQRLRTSIEANPVELSGGGLHSLTVSVGCAEASDLDPASTVDHADQAMYLAKRTRNTVASFAS